MIRGRKRDVLQIEFTFIKELKWIVMINFKCLLEKALFERFGEKVKKKKKWFYL